MGGGRAAVALAAAASLAAFAAAAADASMLLCPRLDMLFFALHTMQVYEQSKFEPGQSLYLA
jgi:hypothetical protein